MGNTCSSASAALPPNKISQRTTAYSLPTELASTRDFTDSIHSEDTYKSVQKSQCYLIPEPTTEELGAIRYRDTHIEGARGQGRPIMCVKAEVPGDLGIGLHVLSHPLIVEAAESLFVPTSVVLRKESNYTSRTSSSWNTTIEFLNKEGENVVPPFGDEMVSLAEVTRAMIDTLKACNKNVPKYLELLHKEEKIKQQIKASSQFSISERKALFGATNCSQAEVEFADLDGVLRTRIGILEGQQILEVEYTEISFASLLHERVVHQKAKNIHTVYVQTMDERVAAQMELSRSSEPVMITKLPSYEAISFSRIQEGLSALRKTEFRFVPLTELQAMRINRLVHIGSFHLATHLLSPWQGLILMKSYSNVSLRKEVVNVPITQAWKSLE